MYLSTAGTTCTLVRDVAGKALTATPRIVSTAPRFQTQTDHGQCRRHDISREPRSWTNGDVIHATGAGQGGTPMTTLTGRHVPHPSLAK
jgi:hypothetical protein